MIDLSKMKGISVDQVNRVAIAQPGLRLENSDTATQAFGLATTMGIDCQYRNSRADSQAVSDGSTASLDLL